MLKKEYGYNPLPLDFFSLLLRLRNNINREKLIDIYNGID